MVDINFIEIAQVCSGAFRKQNKEKTISLELSGFKHDANCGKHLRFTPQTLSDDASYFLASKFSKWVLRYRICKSEIR